MILVNLLILVILVILANLFILLSDESVGSAICESSGTGESGDSMPMQ